jgi:predicted PurR-regulated permease PerM
MHPLMLTLFSIIATTLAGVGVILALTIGQDGLWPILIAAGIGFCCALPISWLVASRILKG